MEEMKLLKRYYAKGDKRIVHALISKIRKIVVTKQNIVTTAKNGGINHE